MRRFVAFGPAFVVLLVVASVLVLGPAGVRRLHDARTHAIVAVAQRTLDQDDILVRLNEAVRNIAVAVEPSVVHLDVVGAGNAPGGSSGAGWVYDQRGHIITNAHVVAGARAVIVQFHDGRVQEATLVGADQDSDIAVIKVEAGDYLFPARRASGERLQRGERVFAFGSPFGFKFSMSEGIVSGLGRSARTAMGAARISNFIQTDAAVNPGNSGGPLVDIRGRVAGMNVAIATAADTRGTTEGQSAGISFAIPLATIESRVEQIIGTGTAVSGYLGVWFVDNAGIAEQDSPRGVRVEDIIDGGPAQRAGIRPGDIVTSIDGEAVIDGQVLSSIISSRTPGDTVALRIWRRGEYIELNAAVGERPDTRITQQLSDRVSSRLGLVMRDAPNAVVISGVEQGSPAALSGLISGQMLRAVNGVPVPDAQTAAALIVNSGVFRGRAARLTIAEEGGGETRVVELRQRGAW
jgi:S1-C subfamily serine protease